MASTESSTMLERRVDAFGTSVVVRTPDAPGSAALLDEMLLAWRDAAPVAAQPAGPLPSVEVPALDALNFEHLAYRFTVQVTTAALEFHRGEQLMLHAGGIARSDGAVVAIAGPSGRGKTTTMSVLAREYGYVSDETITIAGDGSVLPYRKPLSVITEGHAEKLQVAPSELGLLPLPAAELRIAGLVLLDRQPEGIADSVIEPVPLADALIELVQQTSYLVELSDPLRRIAEIASDTGGVRRLRVGIPDRIPLVADRLFAVDGPAASGGPGSGCEAWEQVLPEAPGAAGYSVSDTVVDAVEVSDGTAVLTRDRHLRLLAGAAPLVWRGICAGDGEAELDARISAELGDPPDGGLRDAVSAVCESLVAAGVLVRES